MPSKLSTRLKKAAENSTPYADEKGHKLILIIAGEASADLHGSNLVKYIKKLDTSFRFIGIGGELMREAGVEILFNSSEMAVVGATEVISKIGTIYRAARDIKYILKNSHPDLLILIDYPDFNIHIAHTAKKAGVPVLYFISPQLWAWRKGRVKKIERRIDRMAVILPFEEEFYKERGVTVDYVGHPILDSIPKDIKNDEILKSLNLRNAFPIIGIIPGSRKEEIQRMLPSMVEAAEIIGKRYPAIRCVLPLASTIPIEFVESIIKKSSVQIDLPNGNIYDILSICHAAMVTSGTATLETALMGIPMVVAYKLSTLSYWVGRMVVDVPFISLANLVAGEKVVTELIQHEVTPKRLAEELLVLLGDEEARNTMISKMGTLRNRLGNGSACQKTAEIALHMVGRRHIP